MNIETTGLKLQDIERIVILDSMETHRYNRTHTARALGIGIRTLQRKLKSYGIEPGWAPEEAKVIRRGVKIDESSEEGMVNYTLVEPEVTKKKLSFTK